MWLRLRYFMIILTISKYPKKEIVFLPDLRSCRVGFKTEKPAVYKVITRTYSFIFLVTTNIKVRLQIKL